MSSERTIKCPICSTPYKIYDGVAGDQSACPSCRQKAEQNMQEQYYGRPQQLNG